MKREICGPRPVEQWGLERYGGRGMVYRGHEDLTQDQIAKLQWLLEQGFQCGIRNPQINRKYAGSYQVAEWHQAAELPTDDGSNGPWCIVGDDYGKLIDEAYDVWLPELDGTSGQDRERRTCTGQT